MPSYPSANNATILVCESIRPEQGNKMSVLGLLTGSDVVFTPPATLPASVPLAILVILRDGEGKYAVSARITAPSGKLVTEQSLGEAVKIRNEVLTIALQFGFFLVSELGVYRFEVKLDEVPYRIDVTFAQGPVASS